MQDQPGAGQRRPAADQRPLQRGQARGEVPAGDRQEQHDAGPLVRVRQDVARADQRRRPRREQEGPAGRPGLAEPDRQGRDPRGSRGRHRPAQRGPAPPRGPQGQGRPVVGHQGQPGPQRHRHQEPRAELRGRHRRPADRHDGVQRQGPQGVRRDHARDRAARRRQLRAQRRGAEPDRLLAPLRDPARQRADLDALHQLPREPRRHRRLPGRPDLRRLHAPERAGPRAPAQDRRAAGPPRADLALAGLGDARPAGARPGPRRRHRGLRDRRAVPARLLPRARRDRRARARHLRRLLLRADQAHPDHADAAGHRGPDPHDRRRGGREHRHLRTRQRGDTQRPIYLGRHRAGLQEGLRDDRRREHRHAARRVHPVHPGHRRA